MKFDYYMNNDAELEEKLQIGEAKARKIAVQTLERVRSVMGF